MDSEAREWCVWPALRRLVRAEVFGGFLGVRYLDMRYLDTHGAFIGVFEDCAHTGHHSK